MSDNENEAIMATNHPTIASLINQSRQDPTPSESSRLNPTEAVIKTEMQEIELASTKSTMEILRVENESLRKLVTKLQSMIIQQDPSVNTNSQGLDSTIDGSSANEELNLDADSDNGTVAISSPRSFQTNDNELTILRGFRLNDHFRGSTASSEHGDTIEDTVRQVDDPDSETETESRDGCSEDNMPKDTDKEQEPPIDEKPKPPFHTGISLNNDTSGSLSIYDIPDDFDPENQDHCLSDVETVTSDEALLAWGVSSPAKTERSEIPSTYQDCFSEESDEEGWEPVNKMRSSSNLNYFSGSVTSISSDYTSRNVGYVVEETEAETEEDTSTILGEERSLDVPMVPGEEKAPTISGAGSQGDDDERYQNLMRELGIDDEVDAMEQTRAEAEEEEAKARDLEYKMAIAEKQDETKDVERAQSGIISDTKPTIFFSQAPLIPEAPTRIQGNTVEQRKAFPVDIKKASLPKTLTTSVDFTSTQALDSPPLSSGKTAEEISLLSKFNEIMKTLKPAPSTGFGGGMHGRHSTVGWTNPKQSPSNGLQLDSRSDAQRANEQSNGCKIVSESDRILLSFDPREDVVGILRPKAKGEKNVLDGIAGMAPLISKKAKVTKPQIKNEEPSRKVGIVESQFKILREQQLQHKAEHQVSTSQKPPPTVDISVGKNSPKTPLLSAVKELPIGHFSVQDFLQPPSLERAQDISSRPANKPVQKVLPLSGSPRRRHGIKSRSPPRSLTQRGTVSRIHEHTKEPELNHQKSLRFHDVPISAATKAQPTQFPPAIPTTQSLVMTNDRPKTLISILKPLKHIEAPAMEPKNRSYNYEYIREVCIRNLPKDITYSTLLDQVSGGLLEKVIIDWNTLESRIVFAEPEAARKFYKQVERTGFWVHTEMPHIGLVGNLVQCTLGGFLWTQHSSEMSPMMIKGIWGHRASRCLLINDFPKDIKIEKLIKDILGILEQPAIKEKEIIETAGIKRNLQVSSTGFMACVRFSAMAPALKVANELHNFSPEYTDVDAVYDADPCGGLMGKEPPSIWMRGKQIENEGPEVQRLASSPVPQRRHALPTKSVQTTKSHVTHTNTIKQFGFSSSKTLQKPNQRPPIKPIFRRQPASFSLIAKKLPAPAQHTQKVIIQAVHPPPSRIQPQTLPRPNQSTPPPGIFRYDYDNWDDEPEETIQKPPGAHWNHKEQNLVHEYNQSLAKKRRRGSDASKIGTEVKQKVEIPKDILPYDRQVYLTNLPRDLTIEKFLRFVRGGVVEYVELLGPTSQYDTSTAYILFVHRKSARDYKNYLVSPGLAIERHHRVVDAEITPRNRFDTVRRLPSHHIRRERLTRCLRIDLLPNGTTLEHIIEIIEEGMNHTTLDFEHASIAVSEEDKGTMVVFLRLMSIARAVWTVGIVRKCYNNLLISFDRDPCQGSVMELDEVNVGIE